MQDQLIRVTLLTQADCHFCKDAQAMLERLRSEYPLTVEVRDLAESESQQLALRHGLLFPPGIIVDGAAAGYGRPSEGRLRKLLDARKAELAGQAPQRPSA